MVRDYARTFLRGFVIVTLTAANVSQIAQHHYAPAVAVGFGISLVWWYNSRTAARSDAPGAGFVYASGAALGTLLGMWVAR